MCPMGQPHLEVSHNSRQTLDGLGEMFHVAGLLDSCPRIAQPPTEIVAFLALHAASPFGGRSSTEKLMLFWRTCFGITSWTVSLDDQSEMNLI